MLEIELLVDEFAMEMKRVLLNPHNFRKGDSWKYAPIMSLEAKLHDEFDEYNASSMKDAKMHELVDVASMSMMVWKRFGDNNGRQP